MTIELFLCALMTVIAARVSYAISLHYGAWFGLNLFFLGYTEADSSLLVIAFATMTVIDILLAVLASRLVLLYSAAASFALCLESVGNGDWLLNHSGYLSIAVNTLIICSLLKEYWGWMNGKLQR